MHIFKTTMSYSCRVPTIVCSMLWGCGELRQCRPGEQVVEFLEHESNKPLLFQSSLLQVFHYSNEKHNNIYSLLHKSKIPILFTCIHQDKSLIPCQKSFQCSFKICNKIKLITISSANPIQMLTNNTMMSIIAK